MDLLNEEDTLIVEVTRATCFMYRVDRENTSREDLDLYVSELLRLHSANPSARTATRPDKPESNVRSAVEFCAQQLADVSPKHAAKLRSALSHS